MKAMIKTSCNVNFKPRGTQAERAEHSLIRRCYSLPDSRV